MSQIFECGDNAALVTYLYDECEPAERRAIDTHLAICPVCAAEIAALSSTSLQLAAWTPPALDVNVRVVAEQRASTVVRPARWWQQPMPAWAQAAAAAMIFGAGLSLGVVGGVASGRSVDLAPAAAASALTEAAPPANVASRDDLESLAQRLRAEMSNMRAVPVSASTASSSLSPSPSPSPSVSGSESELLSRVRALIEESEQRQRRELALRTAEVVRDIDVQRQSDFTRIQRVFGQFEGTAGAEIQQQRQDLNNLIRVSQRPQ